MAARRSRSRSRSGSGSRSRSRSTAAVVGAAVLVLIAGCSDDGTADPGDEASLRPAASVASADSPNVEGEVTVFAAASLTEAFTEIGSAFEAAYPGVRVTFNFAASSELVRQIADGAPADVYASADLANMAKLTDAGANASAPVVFATNAAEIIVAPGNPLEIAGVADLADADLVVVTCAPEVPCGTYATEIFDRAGVAVVPDSYEENVKAVVTKVTLGEADAGIAYATDVIAAGDDADGVPIPDDTNVVAEYPMALTRDAPNALGGRAFLAFVLGEGGQSILAQYGFTSP